MNVDVLILLPKSHSRALMSSEKRLSDPGFARRRGEPTRLGLLTQLPEGAEIHVGGPGFSEATVRILCQGAAYFIFLDDLSTKGVALAYA